jgi:tRNA (guanine37-N1)-methyltransferase
VDDAPYGGGQGMLMKCTPFFEALDELCPPGDPACTVFFTPTGEPFSQRLAAELGREERLMFCCGHYEGIDERVYTRATRCISLGDYVLTGGELAALVVIDAVVRLLPGALGDELSAVDESFSSAGLLEYEQYTRPAVADGLGVPPVLVSGDHARVDRWRRANALVRTCERRPDLIQAADLTPQERVRALELVGRLARGEDAGTVAPEIFPELR